MHNRQTVIGAFQTKRLSRTRTVCLSDTISLFKQKKKGTLLFGRSRSFCVATMDSRRREIVPDEESSESINDDVNDSDTVSDSSTVSSSHDSPSGQRDAATGTLQDRSRINARKRDRSPTSPRTYEFESIREGTLKGELISKTRELLPCWRHNVGFKRPIPSRCYCRRTCYKV